MNTATKILIGAAVLLVVCALFFFGTAIFLSSRTGELLVRGGAPTAPAQRTNGGQVATPRPGVVQPQPKNGTTQTGATKSGEGADFALRAKLQAMTLQEVQLWLSQNIGGKPEKWTSRNDQRIVWGYWDPDHVTTFRHPGRNSLLTYWSNFAEASNARGCYQDVPPKGGIWDGTTRLLQCPNGGGATFQADGVGFHPVAP